MFALVDANAFYCSAEQVFRPDWRGKPVIVLSNNDGCIVAANRQAKALGIQKFKPYFTQKQLCQKMGVIVCSSNYTLYGDLSDKMMNVIGRFAPEQYIYSIDESFLSFKNCVCIPDLVEQSRLLRRHVWKECRLAVGVGLGNTLTLAKVANHAAKTFPQFQGVCMIDTELERKQILQATPVGEVWGVGRKITARLNAAGIETAWQLSKQPPAKMRKFLNVELERTVLELNGKPCIHWAQAKANKQQIFSTRSMGERITDFDSLHQALCKHANIAAAKLRGQGSLASVMWVFASNSPYDEQPQSIKRMMTFAFPVDDSRVFCAAISHIMHELFIPNVRYYKVGVGLLDLCDSQFVQPDLFDNKQTNPNVMKAFDALNQQYGEGCVFLAAQGTEQKWGMRREFLTPEYTTNWHDIPKILCK